MSFNAPNKGREHSKREKICRIYFRAGKCLNWTLKLKREPLKGTFYEEIHGGQIRRVFQMLIYIVV